MTAVPNLEQTLMQSIRNKYHAEIDRAIQATLIPPALLAALIANETGGDPTKKRFERNVLLQLWAVVQGRAPHFGSLTQAQIEKFCIDAVALPGSTGEWFPEGCRALDSLATSWGLTQIMGYEAVAFNVPLFVLQGPAANLELTCRMLNRFATVKRIDLKAVAAAGDLPSEPASQLLDCWNTGRPHAPTADPKYIPNGLARMAIYRDLQEEPPKVVSA